MTLPGGPAAKLGNRFEKWWTVSELVRMLRGETDSLRIEPPGLHGVEFVVRCGARCEFHQAKRSHPSGAWSIATLASAGVLRYIGNLLLDNEDRFIFVSGSDARELADLCDAARKAESLNEFKQQFLAAQRSSRNHKHLPREWNCSESQAWSVLRRVNVHTIDEGELETKVRWGLSALFLGNISQVQQKLSAIVEDAVHLSIVRDDLVRQLHDAGYALRRVSGASQARQAICDATDRFLAGARSRLIRESLVPRKDSAKVIDRLTGESPSDCVLTGRAGTGKTACVTEVVEELRQQGAHVLAFRLDRHMSATSTVDLGRRLDLEESPALLLAAAAKADGKPAVLIVDQLDAVSAMSGRGSGAFDIVQQLLIECRSASVHTAIVCRSFDWQHESRLRGLIREEDQRVELGEFSDDEVRGVLARANVQHALGTGQIALLRLPQNLSLFLATDLSKSDALSFSTAKALFDRYWETKKRLVADRTSGGDEWTKVIDTICDVMTETQQLSVRKEKLDQLSSTYVDQCVSENVLVADGDTYGFGHESFFDYCFARRFVDRSDSLAAVLKPSEQHLFRRAQVRQVLVYLRDADFERYVRELRALVSDDDVRTHIKDLVFTLLAGVDDPRDEEWNVWMDRVRPAVDALERGTANEDRLSELAWARLLGAKSWFKYLDDRGVIADWLASMSSPLADRATDYLRRQRWDWPGRVAALLEPYVDQGSEWPNRLRDIVESAHIHASRHLFDLLLKLVDNGTFDLAGSLSSTCWSLANHRPSWVPELLAHQLRRHVARCQTALAEGHSAEAAWSGSLGYDGVPDEAFKRAVAHSPRKFVDHVLPAVLDTSDAARKISVTPPVRDAVWPVLSKGNASSLADACLHALADALGALAGEGEHMGDEISALSSRRTHVANHLLLAVYRGGAARFADEAALAFSEHPWRFDCGYADSSYWCATETIKVAVPHCQPANRTQLEKTILAHVDPYERTKEGFRRSGWAAFNLLAAIPDELRSANAKGRFAQLERKFRQPFPAPKGIVRGWVGSPIAAEAAAKMNDEQWLKAIAAYPSERRRLLHGGAPQLAQDFGRRAKAEPERFATIGLQLPSTTNPVYFSELLRGLADTSLAEETKVRLCQRVFEYARDECGKDIARLIRTTTRVLPKEAVDMLIALATERHDSEEEAWRQDAGGGQPNYGGDIYLNGIDTTRGQAAEAMGELIEKEASYIRQFQPALDELVCERTPSVASCVASTLRAVAYHDPALGLELFLRTDFSEERLLGTPHVCEFMRENLSHGFPSLKNMTLRMLRSPHPDPHRAGAQLVCLAAFTHEDALELAAEALQGDRQHRLGVADVALANVTDPICRQWCEGALTHLFDDSDLEVRNLAALCFRHLPEDRLADYGDLMQAFLGSPRYKENPFFLLEALLKSARGQLPDIVCLACESFLDHLVSVPGRGTNSRMVVELAFRVYQQHQNDEWRSRALDLIDRICLGEPHEAAEGFEMFGGGRS